MDSNRHLLALALVVAGATPMRVVAQSFCEPVPAEPLVAPVVLGNGTPGSVTTAQIQAALDAGGHIRIDVGAAPSTIVVASTLVASRETVLDGGGVVTLSGGDVRRILSIVNPNPAPNAPLFRVTLQNIAFADARIADGRGAAIYKEHDFEFAHKVSLKLVNCTFSGNDAPLDATPQDDGGGAFYGELLQRIDVGNCRFDNTTGSNGGALYSLGSLRVNIVDSTFSGNRAIGDGGNPGGGGNAGALGIDGAQRLVDVCRTRFTANEANAHGAGFFSVMYDQMSRVRFEDVEFRGNRQLGSDQHTGGAYIQDGPRALERVTFIDNEAVGFGGLGVFDDPGNASGAPGTLRNSTFSGNIARTGLGGAMTLPGNAAISIVNTTIAANVATAAFAGGINIDVANQLRLTNVVLANNSGGNRFVSWGIRNPAAFDGGGNVQWPQVRPMNGGNEVRATPTTQFVDPLVAAAANNGGFAATVAIAMASPARDSGVSTAEVPPTDQRLLLRVGPPDSGSYEFGAEGVILRDGFEDP